MRPVCLWDIECYVNFFSVAFMEVHGQRRTKVFERLEDRPLDIEGVHKILRHHTIIGFNSIGYDNPILALALSGATNLDLKTASDKIIIYGVKWWQFRELYGVELPGYVDGIDLMEVSPGAPTHPSLKLYAGRMHSRKMQDLPIDPSATLTPEQMDTLRAYGLNDLEVTKDLYSELKPQVLLRMKMSERYKTDLRSKSDAQVAEAVIKAEVHRRTNRKVYKPDIAAGKFMYRAPDYIRFRHPRLGELLRGTFESQQLRELRDTFESSPFVVDTFGRLWPSATLEKGIVFTVGMMKYTAGYGGLHSKEKSTYWVSDDEYVLVDTDATSYYAALILASGLYPKHIGPVFRDIYREIYNERVAAKRADNKDKAESLKVTILGAVGKFGSSFSALFSPELLLQVTLTGQLAILMMIERIEASGMQVVSANTDGVVTLVPRARRDVFNRIVAQWEINTGFMTEEVEYTALYSRDVNSYLAFKPDGTVKRKGMFTECGRGLSGAAGLKKNPTNEVCIDAVIAYLANGKAIEESVRECADVRKFVTVRRVTGGAEKNGDFIGKSIRWYFARGETGAIAYVSNGNTVPKTEGAKPIMELPDNLPDDIDFEHYIHEAYATLEDIGVRLPDPRFAGRTGEIRAHLPDQSTIHIVDLGTSRARCGRVSPSLRKSWIEVESVEGLRVCRACREGL